MNLHIRSTGLRIALAIVLLFMAGEAMAQRGRGGGGGGRSMGGGGRSPSISRPASRPQTSRPQVNRPSPSRPSTGRPSTGRPSTGRPSTGLPSTGRPGAGNPGAGRPNIERPSNNRPTTNRPNTNRPATGRPSGERPNLGGGNVQRPGNAPSRGDLGNFLDLDRPTGRPSGNRPSGNAASDFLQNRPSTLPAERPGGLERPGGGNNRPGGVTRPAPGDRPNIGDRPGDGNRPGQGTRPTPGNRPNIGDGNQRPDRPTTLPEGPRPGYRPPTNGHRPGYRPPQTRPPYYRPPGSRPPGYRPPGYRPPPIATLPVYRPGYWAGGSWRWGWGNYNQNWWAWATAGAVTGWIANSVVSGPPVYYDYGNTLYYEGDNVVYNNEVIATTTEYAEQAQQIATSIPEDVDPESVEWMPLGVFALTDRDGLAEDATMFLQLAVSKEGIVAGSFENSTTGNKFEVEGAVDSESQRAAWGPVGENWPIMETGLYNLTENEASALLHFENGETQEWKLTRLDEPEDQ